MANERADSELDALGDGRFIPFDGMAILTLEGVFQKWRPYLLKYAEANLPYHLRARASSEDILQTAFLCLFSRIDTLEIKDYSHAFLLIRLAVRRRALNVVRSFNTVSGRAMQGERSIDEIVENGQFTRNQFESSDDSPSSRMELNEDMALVSRAFRGLSEREQVIVELRCLESRSYPQIATQLDIKEDAARVCYGRAIEKLRKLLDRD